MVKQHVIRTISYGRLTERRDKMGFFGKLFEKKICDVCGEEIKLLGNRKLEDGNLCKDCASKLSPWFDERRHSTVDQIKEQLAYREANKEKVNEFRVTASYGKGGKKLLIDENTRRFTVAAPSDLQKGNPDILEFADARSCNLQINELKHELKRTVDGKSESYNPPKYEYSYEFVVKLFVDNPYFDDMAFTLTTFAVKTGQHRMGEQERNWNVRTVGKGLVRDTSMDEYNECLNIGNQIKDFVENVMMRNAAPQAGYEQMPAAETVASAAGAPVTCPYCDTTAVPTPDGKCSACGATL